ncbi:MAG: hypothetical protein OXE87_04835 [Chloroflexi bacterium]|nr:hypothetical protein [Chloroflexota bacterium]
MTQPQAHHVIVHTSDGKAETHMFPVGDTPEEQRQIRRELAELIQDVNKNSDGTLILGSPFVAYLISHITKIVWVDGYIEADEKPPMGFIRPRQG